VVEGSWRSPLRPEARQWPSDDCQLFVNSVLTWNRRQQGTRFRDDAVLELRVAHERGAEHGAAALVVVHASLTRFIEQYLGDHARGALQGAPVLDVRSEHREDVFPQEAQEDVGIAPEAGGRAESRFDRVEAQPRSLPGKLQRRGEGALLRCRIISHLPDDANVVFVASGVEDPERKPAKMAGFRGGRYISAEASVRGEREPGGSKMAGADAYTQSVLFYWIGNNKTRLWSSSKLASDFRLNENHACSRFGSETCAAEWIRSLRNGMLKNCVFGTYRVPQPSELTIPRAVTRVKTTKA
jgi:hypothetical protein